MRKIFKKYNILNGGFIILMLSLFFMPSAEAFEGHRLMEPGSFQPTAALVSDDVGVPGDLSGIQFKDASGKVVDLGDLKGKVIFLNFWATWCPPCLAEMPSINKLYEQFKEDKDIVFLLIDADSNLAKAQKYMDRKSYNLPVYISASSVPAQIFKGALPTTVVFDKQGRVSYRESGAANYASPKFITFIEKLKAD